MVELVLGIAAAVGASTLYSLGIALQAMEAKEAPPEEHLRLALAKIRQPEGSTPKSSSGRADGMPIECGSASTNLRTIPKALPVAEAAVRRRPSARTKAIARESRGFRDDRVHRLEAGCGSCDASKAHCRRFLEAAYRADPLCGICAHR